MASSAGGTLERSIARCHVSAAPRATAHAEYSRSRPCCQAHSTWRPSLAGEEAAERLGAQGEGAAGGAARRQQRAVQGEGDGGRDDDGEGDRAGWAERQAEHDDDEQQRTTSADDAEAPEGDGAGRACRSRASGASTSPTPPWSRASPSARRATRWRSPCRSRRASAWRRRRTAGSRIERSTGSAWSKCGPVPTTTWSSSSLVMVRTSRAAWPENQAAVVRSSICSRSSTWPCHGAMPRGGSNSVVASVAHVLVGDAGDGERRARRVAAASAGRTRRRRRRRRRPRCGRAAGRWRRRRRRRPRRSAGSARRAGRCCRPRRGAPGSAGSRARRSRCGRSRSR